MSPIKQPYKIGYRHGQKTFYNSSHLGVDIIVSEMTPVYAPDDGKCNTFFDAPFHLQSNRCHSKKVGKGIGRINICVYLRIIWYSIFMSIKRTKTINAIVIHHTVVPEQSATQEKASEALNRNKYAYDGKPPYHYIIGNTWDYQGRPYDTIGYHAGSPEWNAVAIGVVLVGNFNNDTITAHQKKRLGEVIKTLMKQYSIPRNRVFLHKEIRPKPTACPGSSINQQFISSLLIPMTTDQETIRQLNEEIGVTTAQRDKALTDLKAEQMARTEETNEKLKNYENWQRELDLRKKLEALITGASDKLQKIKEIVGL